jgi:hypothetical protein
MKMVRAGSAPLDVATGLAQIKTLAQQAFAGIDTIRLIHDVATEAREAYVDCIVIEVIREVWKAAKMTIYQNKTKVLVKVVSPSKCSIKLIVGLATTLSAFTAFFHLVSKLVIQFFRWKPIRIMICNIEFYKKVCCLEHS